MSATTFIGVDLAWQGTTNHTGIAVARENDGDAELVAVASGITSFEAAVAFIAAHATEHTVVAIDAPLILKNDTGRRPCETLISRKFGARHAGAHSSNLTLYPCGGPARLVAMLAAHGFAHDLVLEQARKRNGRWIFEVYPHPAQVVLFDRAKIIRYKKGSVGEKRAGLATLQSYLADALPAAEPALQPATVGRDLLATDLGVLNGRRLKEHEDVLDAWFCAYQALYLWWWGAERNEMLGDLDTGYIVVPTRPLHGRAPIAEPSTTLIVPPGTRVVAHAAVTIPETGRLHPAGVVGVITRAPGDVRERYRVRFTDASEAGLRRSEFTILKAMKEGGLAGASLGQDVDWNAFVIYRCVVGSRAYGLDDEESDTDRRGFFLPPAELHWSLYGVPEQLENEATQETYWELEKFVRLALKANPNILECLYTPLVDHASELAQELLDMRAAFLSRLTYQTYNGYVLSQFKRLEQDLRTRGAIKWKHAMHLIRLLVSGITILREGHVPVRVEEHRDALLAIKRGERTWEEVDAWRLDLHRQFDEAFAHTALPEQPDFARANDYLLRARRAMVTR